MRAARLMGGFCALALLAGCTDYYDHDDRMTPYSGEAIAANGVAQMVDPWPAASRSPRYGTHGDRMQRAITNYKNDSTATSSSSSSSSSGESSGNGEESNNSSSSSGSSSAQ